MVPGQTLRKSQLNGQSGTVPDRKLDRLPTLLRKRESKRKRELWPGRTRLPGEPRTSWRKMPGDSRTNSMQLTKKSWIRTRSSSP